MRVHFTAAAWEEYLSWQTDKAVLARLHALINEIRRTPFTGTGKPEPLRGEWQGWWSRRITKEHRLVYASGGAQDEQHITIAQCRDHY